MAICAPLLTYSILVDWNNDGDYSDTSENVTADILMRPVSWVFGRDQDRSLAPAGPGEARWTLCNSDLLYSPGGSSPIAANVLPGRPILITLTPTGGALVTGWGGFIDNVDVHTEKDQQNVDFSAIDALTDRISGDTVTTTLYETIRTGDAITVILDEIGWPVGKRSIDSGATVIPYWWLTNVAAGEAIDDLVRAEGDTAICYVDGGVITFKDRLHRAIDTNATSIQDTYCVTGTGVPCVTGISACPGGSLIYTDPFVYDHGLKNVINYVSIQVVNRWYNVFEVPVWTTDDSFVLGNSASTTYFVATEDPFKDAIAPVSGVDFQVLAGSATATLSQTSGSSTIITVTAGAGGATINGLQLRARGLVLKNLQIITSTDATSVAKYGQQRYPEEIPWVNAYDAQAIADSIVDHRKGLVPVVQLRTVNKDQAHENAIVARDISDQLTVRNDRLGVNTQFYVERVEHTLMGLGQIHAQVLGMEQKVVTQPTNLFIFDGSAGHRFDEGVFAE